ncbi:MAG: signal peptidase II [Patescibacteria group bacterium]|jgi:signal peptidase II
MKKYFFIILSFFILDRFTKIYILKNPLPDFGGGFFDLHINTGVAFSLPVIYLFLYPLVVLILVLLFYFWKKDFDNSSILIWPWGLIIIGAISNFMDRIKYGGVIDFISVPYFTVLNLSDIYISLGVVWVLWFSWFFKKSKIT